MSSTSKTALGSFCLLLVATSTSWTTPSTGLSPGRSHSTSATAVELQYVPRSKTSQIWPADSIVDEAQKPLKGTPSGKRPSGWRRIFRGKMTNEAQELSAQKQPEKRRRGWRHIFRRRTSKSTEGEPFDERKLSRLPYFMRHAETLQEKLLKLFDRFVQPLRRKKVMADLYRRHAEDERIYGAPDDDDT